MSSHTLDDLNATLRDLFVMAEILDQILRELDEFGPILAGLQSGRICAPRDRVLILQNYEFIRRFLELLG